uniref:Lipase n=1 Tax=Steinernema glaseri TaxID=37863 RepID=A0A1I8A892_9BILA
MQKFDYGTENSEKYGIATPPLYDISRVDVDTYLFWSEKDWLADKKDIETGIIGKETKDKLNPKVLRGNYELKDFNHMDFIWGTRAANEIYKPIIKIIDEDFRRKH